MAYQRRYKKDQPLPEEAEPLKNMTITAIALAEDLRTSIAFGDSDVPLKWKRFMTFFSMLYGVTKFFIDKTIISKTDDFMKKWFLYGYAVKKYKALKNETLKKGALDKNAEKALEDLNKIFMEVNPARSLDVFEEYVKVLKKRGIYTMKESTIGDEGFGEGEDEIQNDDA